MSTHNTPWPAGTPCWVDLSADDQAAAQSFYTTLLGWEYEVGGPEFGGYAMAKKDGLTVAGLGGKMNPEQPTVWTTYLASDNLDETAEKISASGGAIHVAPMDVSSAGRMMIATDPCGAVFGAWQAGETTGFELVNSPGGVIWNEQLSRDVPAAKAFYQDAFGLTASAMAADGSADYFTLAVGDEMVAGLGPLGEVPAEVPAHWYTYFAVADVDAAAALLLELGGSLRQPPFDQPWGRTALAIGAQGEPFAMIQAPAEGYPHSDKSAS